MKYLILILLLASCSPVKRVLNNKEMFDQVAVEMVKRGICVNDTTIITQTKDSIVYKDSIIERITSVPCKDFDTTIGRARISVSSGVLTYSSKDSVVYRTKTITKNIRDKKLEAILQKDIASRDSIILSYKNQILDLRNANQELTWEHRKQVFKFWLLVIASAAVTFRKQIIKLIWPYLK
jgi:hypothetical protein